MRYTFSVGYRIVPLRKSYHLGHPGIVLATLVRTYVGAMSVYTELHTYRIQLGPIITVYISIRCGTVQRCTDRGRCPFMHIHALCTFLCTYSSRVYGIYVF